MIDKSELQELMKETIEIVCILNRLLEIENMKNVDYSNVLDDLKWNKVMLRNRLDNLNEFISGKSEWINAKKYMENLDKK